MPKFDLSADYLAAAATFRGYEETRRYLNGVYACPHVDPATGKGALLVATDGHLLAAIHDRDGVVERPAILAFDHKAKALKAARGDGTPRRLRFDLSDARSTVPVSAGVFTDDFMRDAFTVSEVDGEFPDFWRVIPARDTWGQHCEGAFGVNTQYLADCTAASERATGNKRRIIGVWRSEVGAPMIVETGFADGVFVVMPVRCAARDTAPDWLEARE